VHNPDFKPQSHQKKWKGTSKFHGKGCEYKEVEEEVGKISFSKEAKVILRIPKVVQQKPLFHFIVSNVVYIATSKLI
jgi:hypothetical protein